MDFSQQRQGRKSISDAIAGFGASVMKGVTNFFSGEAEDDDAPVVVEALEEELVMKNNPVKGFGYGLSFCYYADQEAHAKPFFYTSALGAPFPSYHTNPSPDFPARWTEIEGVKMPCESLTAPRIRLSPTELKQKQRVLGRIRDAASFESKAPRPTTLNLAYQNLGDPYQYEAFVTFWDINKNATILNLTDNQLDDVTDLDLSSVRKLYLSRNNFSSFLMIPVLENCEELYISDNFITSLKGCETKRFPKLRKLTILNNPIEEMGEKYKGKLIAALPTLELLNDFPVEDY